MSIKEPINLDEVTELTHKGLTMPVDFWIKYTSLSKDELDEKLRAGVSVKDILDKHTRQGKH